MDRTLLQTQMASVAAELGSAFGTFVFTPTSGPAVNLIGPCSPLRPADPLLEDASDRMILLAVATAALPAPLPVPGSFLTRDGRKHRIVRCDAGAPGITEITLVA